MDNKKCPVCNEVKYVNISLSNSNFRVDTKGSVDIIGCPNCGVLRISQNSINFRKLKD